MSESTSQWYSASLAGVGEEMQNNPTGTVREQYPSQLREREMTTHRSFLTACLDGAVWKSTAGRKSHP